MKKAIESILKKYKSDPTRLLDIYWELQRRYGYISEQALEQLSRQLNRSVAELRDTLSFYHFFHSHPAGKNRIYLSTCAIAQIKGQAQVAAAFEQELGIELNQSDTENEIGLYTTACMGMCDQGPAALINGVPITGLTPKKAKSIITKLKRAKPLKAEVINQVQAVGPVLTQDYIPGRSLELLFGLKPDEIIEEVVAAGIRGRGGAGFATGKKWQLCQGQAEQVKYVVCNADEGEPGTFKDRYLLTQRPEMVFEGMAIAARAIGAREGLVYLRAEYAYLLKDLEGVLKRMRSQKRLGRNILGVHHFNFDIRIQLGAGSYVVGEETALLESLEGKRGEPRVRPPFPVESGYLGKPTIVNNVETFASVAKIIEHGADWYRQFGTKQSPGTKLLSISGDCSRPGIYEVEWGVSIAEILAMVGATDALFLQVGGPSGECVRADSERRVCFEDLPTGGSIMIFDKSRDLIEIVKNFTQFFQNESCGCCVPCRAGTIVLNEQIDAIVAGQASQRDLERIVEYSKIIAPSSRCGLGQTCSNPLMTSLQEFKTTYENRVAPQESLYHYFDLKEKTQAYQMVVEQYEE